MVRSESIDGLTEKLDAIKDVVDRLEYTMNGNGTPGMKTRLDRLEQSYRFHKWIVGLFAPALVGAIIELYMKVLK